MIWLMGSFCKIKADDMEIGWGQTLFAICSNNANLPKHKPNCKTEKNIHIFTIYSIPDMG